MRIYKGRENWKKEDIEILKEKYPTYGPNIPELLKNHKKKNIRCAAHNHGVSYLNANVYWSQSEIDLLKKHYPHKLKQELKTLLSNRSVKSIERKAEEMKLKRTEETIFREIGNATKLKWIKGCFIDDWDSPIPREYDKSFNNLMKKYIAKRDNYTCQMCGKTKCDGGRFAVHHINYDKKFSDESNLIYLCNSCHMKTNVNRESWKSKFSAMAKDKYKPYRIEIFCALA